jgi:hypothetical protein
MNSQNAKQLSRIAISGLVLIVIGLLIAVFYAYRLNDEIDILRERDLGYIIVGLSTQLLGFGLIAIGKKSS